MPGQPFCHSVLLPGSRFWLFRERSGAAKPPNLSALRQIITQYKVTRSITLLGQGFHPLDTGAGVVTLHPTQRALPSGHPTGAAALHPAQRFHLWTLTRCSPLWTWRKGPAALCTPAVLPETRSCPCSLSSVSSPLARFMQCFSRKHIRFRRSFFFQAAMSFDRNIVAEKRPLSRISKR